MYGLRRRYKMYAQISAGGIPLKAKDISSFIQQIEMKSLNEYLKAVKHKFPEEGERIENLYQSDEDFRALCEDYFSCLQFLHKFKNEVKEKKYSFEEYKNIQEELEKELHDFIFTRWFPSLGSKRPLFMITNADIEIDNLSHSPY